MMATKYRPQRRKAKAPRWQAVEDHLARTTRPPARLPLWWHLWVLGHDITVKKVSAPLRDPSARGLSYRCSCGRGWAK